GGAAAAQQLDVVERAHRRPLLAPEHGRHREIETSGGGETGILRAAAKDRVADMGMNVDEAGCHHLVAPVDHPPGRRVPSGHDGDILEREIGTADALFAWNFDRANLAERAPRLRWIHAHGAGVSHLMPLDWLPRGAVLTNSRGVHGPKADEYTAMAILMLNN